MPIRLKHGFSSETKGKPLQMRTANLQTLSRKAIVSARNNSWRPHSTQASPVFGPTGGSYMSIFLATSMLQILTLH